MKLFSNYVRSHKRCELKILAKYYLTQEVKDVLSKYNLTLYELCYRIKYNISLDKIFVCKYCGKPTHFLGMKGYSKACSVKCELVNRNKSQEHKDKKKQTCLKRFGESNYAKTQKFKEFIKDHINEIQVKSYNTKKKNNSFHTSKDENEAYDLLLTKFTKDDIIRQYKSEVYPFVCDFYIKSLDLYIEYNGTWTHGYDINGKCLGSFDENNLEHIKLLEFWENKSKEVNFKKKVKTYYKNAIYTWTVLDVKKLETFRKNNLNYKIFWNLEEVKNWIDNLV